MIRLAWRMLAQHPMKMAATAVGLLYGAAVVAACGALFESALRYHGTNQRYAASPVLVATTQLTVIQGRGQNRDVSTTVLPDRGRVDDRLSGRIATLAGVQAVVADSAVPIEVVAAGAHATTAGLSVSGHPWAAAALAPFALQDGAPPASARDVVIDATVARATGVWPGQAVRLVLPDGTRTFTVTGIAAAPGRGVPPPGEEPSVFFTDEQARSLAGHPGTADILAVLARPGVTTNSLAAAVRSVLPARPGVTGAYPSVYRGADRGLATSPAAAGARYFLIATSTTFGGSTLLVAIVVIAGTVGLSVRQRHRDIALLRAIAATPRQVRAMVLTETLALAAVAGGAGSCAGLAAAVWLRRQLVSRGLVPDSFTLHISWLPAIAAVVSVALVGLVAAGIASWRTSRTRPVEALRDAALETGGRLSSALRLTMGLIALGGGIALIGVSAHLSATAAASTAIGTVSTLVIAAALLSPWLMRATVGLLAVGLRVLGVSGRLAAANLAASVRRLSPVVTALVLALSLAGSLWFLQTSILHTAVQQSRAGLRADQVITSPGPGLPDGAVASARRVPGVTAATGIVHGSLLDNQGNTYTAQGIDPQALPATLDLAVTAGRMSALAGDTVAVDTVTADALHVQVGRPIRAWYGDGARADLQVAAIYRRGLGFANFTLNSAILRPHTSTGLDAAVLVADARGANRAAVEAAVQGAVRPVSPVAVATTQAAYRASIDEALNQNIWSIHAIVNALLVYVVIAALNTLATAAFARRRELANLRLTGTTKGQLVQMVCVELVVLLGLALVLGGLIAAVTLIPMVRGTTGSPTPYIPLGGWATVIGSTMLVGVLGTLLPLAAMLRIPPIRAIGTLE